MQNFDTIIVGGGLSGILTAGQLFAIKPDRKVALLESDAAFGGRLTSVDSAARSWNYGFSYLNFELFTALDQLLKTDPSSDDLTSYCAEKLDVIGILAGGKLSHFQATDFFSQKSMKAYGGVTAAREWPEIEKVFNDGVASEKDFKHVFPLSKKSSIATVLEAYARILGIPDFWHTTPRIFATRAQELASLMHVGAWHKPLTEILGRLSAHFYTAADCYVVSAEFNDESKSWSLHTRKGDFTCQKLIVALSPWQALTWLAKKNWPTALLNVASKSKPVSTVCISYQVKNIPATLPDVILIPSEETCAVHDHNGHIIFQSHIDFELSLQAPNVLKSVKSLHRAAKKFSSVIGNVELSHEHIALMSVGGALSTTAHDQKYFEKLDLTKLQQKHLMFVGDAYGNHLLGDLNILDSLQTAMKVFN